MSGLRRIGMLAATSVVAVSVPVLGAAPANAAAYRYWSYWHVAGDDWQFSQVGAGGWRVQDGSVEGWHFAVSPNTRSAAPPRQSAASAFSQVCGSEPKPTDEVRVALVLDFGVATDYPPGDGPPAQPLVGDCITVPERSTGVDVLNEAKVSIRDQAGLVCALNGHPATGCGEVVSDPDPTPTKTVRPTKRPTGKPTTKPTPAATHLAGASATATRTRGSATGKASPSRTADGADTSADSTPTSRGSAPASAIATTPTPSTSAVAGAATTPSPGDAPDASPTLAVGLAASQTTDSGTPWPALVVVLVVVALGAGAWWTRRGSHR